MTKRSLSLIEILVGMALFSVLSSLLFGLYMGLVKMSAVQKKNEMAIERLIKMHTILAGTLGRALPQKVHEDNDRLVFTFDNGIDPDPVFSSIIQGVLQVNEQGDLIIEETALQGLATRTLLLTSGIDHLHCELLPSIIRITIDDEVFAVILEKCPPIVSMP